MTTRTTTDTTHAQDVAERSAQLAGARAADDASRVAENPRNDPMQCSTSRLSSPAQAGDPVLHSLAARGAVSRPSAGITGPSAFADDDSREGVGGVRENPRNNPMQSPRKTVAEKFRGMTPCSAAGTRARKNPRNNPMQSHSQPGKPCGARTRAGTPCPTPAMPNGRCRMHGGLSPGPPKGSRNALKHGRHSAAEIARRREIGALIRRMRALARAVG
jgi:hypothetical protein